MITHIPTLCLLSSLPSINRLYRSLSPLQFIVIIRRKCCPTISSRCSLDRSHGSSDIVCAPCHRIQGIGRCRHRPNMITNKTTGKECAPRQTRVRGGEGKNRAQAVAVHFGTMHHLVSHESSKVMPASPANEPYLMTKTSYVVTSQHVCLC